MPCIYVKGELSKSPEHWKKLHPAVHWKKGRSARALAYPWEDNPCDFPKKIKTVLDNAGFPWVKTRPLIISPEHEVPLPGRGKASTNDVFVLANADGALASITVEGKVDEGFDKVVSEWSRGTSNQERRLKGICNHLNLKRDQIQDTSYQLLHRSASAVIEAKRFRAPLALMIVQSFDTSTPQNDFEEYSKFVSLYNIQANENELIHVGSSGADLHLAWIRGDPNFLNQWGQEAIACSIKMEKIMFAIMLADVTH